VGRPLDVVATTLDPSITLAQLAEAGVKRVSVGGSLPRLALATFLEGAREMKDRARVHMGPRRGSEPGAAGDLERARPRERLTRGPLTREAVTRGAVDPPGSSE
jgi:hypothetical protein